MINKIFRQLLQPYDTSYESVSLFYENKASDLLNVFCSRAYLLMFLDESWANLGLKCNTLKI